MLICPHCGGSRLECSRTCNLSISSTQAKAALHSIQRELLAFADGFDGWMDFAFEAFFNRDRRPEPWEEANVLAYALYGYLNAEGQRLIDIYTRTHVSRLSRSETAALHILRRGWFSLFEVQEIYRDKGLKLVDQMTGEVLYVQERQATRHLVKYDCLLAWISCFGDHYELTGASATVPRCHRLVVRDAIKRALRRLVRLDPNANIRTLLCRCPPFAHHALRLAIRTHTMPRLVTTDGDEVLFCSAMFDLKDPERALHIIASHPDLEADGNELTTFHWLDKRPHTASGGTPRLGTIALRGNGRLLKLETASRERLKKGKALLHEALGELIKHRLDAFQDAQVAFESSDQPPWQQKPGNAQREAQARLVVQYMQNHLLSWVDEQLPILRGKTPREAARTKRGREQVEQLLHDQENSTAKLPGGERVDFSAAYRELGLAKVE